jgi:hypothetical protein
MESVDIVSKKEGVLIHGRICRELLCAYSINRLSVEHLELTADVADDEGRGNALV